MHGNVWEWVIDEYFEEGYTELEGEAHQADQVLRWPTKAYPRVVRGGSWDDEPQSCRSAAKLASHDVDWKSEDPNLPLSPWWFTSDPSRAVGFRYVRPLKKVAQEDLEAFYRADAEEIQFDVKARLDEGRGVLGLVDEKLPAAIKELGTP